jgi:ClpP class serine protease
MDAQSGLTSYEQLGNEILDAATDPQVRGMLLRFDSYGGEANGLRYTTIFAGDRKNDFNPHEPLSAEARDVLVAEVNRLYGMFVDAVARRRSLSAEDVRSTEAGILYGEDSVARGFADRVGTFRDALAAMTESLSKPKFVKGGTPVSETIQAAASPPVADLAAIEAEARQQGYAEAAEIVVLCTIAGRTALASDYITRRLSAAEVRKELLALRAEADSEEIRSHVLPEASTVAKQNLDDNPVVKACLALAGAKGAK